MTWSWTLTPPAAATGSDLPPESLEWLGVDVSPVSTQEETKRETDGLPEAGRG